MLKLENIEKKYFTNTIETTALKDINLSVENGQFISIMGPSGCGKSTLLNVAGLLAKPTKGNVFIDDKDVSIYRDRKKAKLRNRKVGFIFQSFHLINDLSVIDNVELPLLYRFLSGKERRKKAKEALAKVGLSSRIKHFPNQLSGGQRQRVAIARAIVGNPEIILADEPTGNLDSTMGREIMDILINLNKEENAMIIMVTHDENLAKITHNIIRLFDGRQVS